MKILVMFLIGIMKLMKPIRVIWIMMVKMNLMMKNIYKIIKRCKATKKVKVKQYGNFRWSCKIDPEKKLKIIERSLIDTDKAI